MTESPFFDDVFNILDESLMGFGFGDKTPFKNMIAWLKGISITKNPNKPLIWLRLPANPNMPMTMVGTRSTRLLIDSEVAWSFAIMEITRPIPIAQSSIKNWQKKISGIEPGCTL